MTDIQLLEACLLPLNRRTPPQPCFFRIIGRDAKGRIPALVEQYRILAEKDGANLSGLPNPREEEISRFYREAGTKFALDAPLIARQVTLWLGQIRANQRPQLCRAVYDTLALLHERGANDHILKNVYTKFMCWLRGPLGSVLPKVGGGEPPKVLFEGDVSKHEVFFLYLLQQAGCDVWYLHYTSSASYDKADPEGRLSQRISGELLSAPPPPAPPPPPPPPWDGAGRDLLVNQWVSQPVWEAAALPYSQRTGAAPGKRGSVFAVLLGADERKTYRNRLFGVKRALDHASRTWILQEQKIQPPTPSETEDFRITDRKLSRPQLIQALAERMPAGHRWTPLAQRALALVMEQFPDGNENRFFNYSVRLACWLRRFAEQLFAKPQTDYPPALLYYGPVTEPEVSLLWALAQMGADVLFASPEKTGVFANHFLPHIWIEVTFEDSLPMEPFPRREEKLLARTTAYDAAQELNKILYSDTGMFRDRQFARSQPVTLKTTYDEVGQLWPEEAQYRPSFRTEDGVVYVPNLFAKICGVDKGDLSLYWDGIRAMLTPNTYLITALPFLQTQAPNEGMDQNTARTFLHDGRLDPKAIVASRAYRYGYLPEDTQNYILEKIQALMDYDLIVDGGPDVLAVTLSVLMNLDKELLRLLQSFDFTRTIPKLLIVDVTETMFTLEECILLAFLNLVGFDIAVFTPTGYRNLETHIRPDSFNTLVVGEFCYDLTVPDLRTRRPAGKAGWLDRLLRL